MHKIEKTITAMLQLQFLLVNAHFTLYLLGALVCFAVTWLYFDAWTGRHDIKESTKALGFFLLTLSFLVESTVVEQSLLSHSLLGTGITDSLIAVTRVSAYLVLIVGQLIDPLQPLPTYRFKDSAAAIMIAGVPLFDSFLFVYPILAMVTSFLYIRRATVGLEFHLRTIGYSFALLSISELFGVAESFRDAANPFVAQLAAPFGIFWIGKHVFCLFTCLSSAAGYGDIWQKDSRPSYL